MRRIAETKKGGLGPPLNGGLKTLYFIGNRQSTDVSDCAEGRPEGKHQ